MAGKTYTVEEKYNIIFESISTNQAITEICRKHGISPSTSNCTISFPEYSYPACFTSGSTEVFYFPGEGYETIVTYLIINAFP